MGFWIMIISGLLGLILIILGFSRKISKVTRYLLLCVGLIIIVFAILLATPQGAELLQQLNFIR